jgi:hypothetical protein
MSRIVHHSLCKLALAALAVLGAGTATRALASATTTSMAVGIRITDGCTVASTGEMRDGASAFDATSRVCNGAAQAVVTHTRAFLGGSARVVTPHAGPGTVGAAGSGAGQDSRPVLREAIIETVSF